VAALTAVLVAASPLPHGVASVARAAGPAGGMQKFYDVLAQAEEADAARQLARAADLYTEAYDALPPAERATEIGSDVVRAAARVRRDQFFENPKDPAPLAPSAALLERHLADVRRLQPDRDVSELEKELTSVTALQEGFAETETETETDEAETEPTPDPIPVVDTETTTTDPPDDPVPRDRRPLGLGLTIGGAIGIAGGATLLALGGSLHSSTTSTYNSRRGLAPEDCTLQGSICELEEWKDGEYARANAMLAVGSILAAAGIGLVIGGATVLARNRKEHAFVLGPLHTRAGTGLTVSGSF
jgi:hypothetical protein